MLVWTTFYHLLLKCSLYSKDYVIARPSQMCCYGIWYVCLIYFLTLGITAKNLTQKNPLLLYLIQPDGRLHRLIWDDTMHLH